MKAREKIQTIGEIKRRFSTYLILPLKERREEMRQIWCVKD